MDPTRPLLHPGQRQQLLRQGGGALHRALHLAHQRGRLHRPALPGLQLGLQYGQRRAQLVRGIGHEALLLGQHVAHARHQRVERPHHRQQFGPAVRFGQRRQRLPIALVQFAAQVAQGAQCMVDRQHRHQRHGQQQQPLGGQCLPQQRARHRFAVGQRLGHLHRHDAGALVAFHRLVDHSHAHRCVAHLVVVQAHQTGVAGRRRQRAAVARQRFITRQQFSLQPGDAVEEHPSGLGRVQFQHRIGHGHAHALALQPQCVGDGVGSRHQLAIERRLRRRQRIAIEPPGTQCQDGCQRQQDAQQQACAQRDGSHPGHLGVSPVDPRQEPVARCTGLLPPLA